jgi:hypothetical protein
LRNAGLNCTSFFFYIIKIKKITDKILQIFFKTFSKNHVSNNVHSKPRGKVSVKN